MRWRRVLRNPSRASILGEYVCCLICNRKWRFSRHDGKVNVELPCIWFCSGAVRDLSAYMTGRLVFFPSFWPSFKSELYTFDHKQVILVSIRKTDVPGGGLRLALRVPSFYTQFFFNMNRKFSNNNGFDWHAFFTFFAQVSEEFVLCINNKSFIVYKYVDEQNWYFLCRGLFIMFIWRT